MSGIYFFAKGERKRELIARIKCIYFVGVEVNVHADAWRHIDADDAPDVRMPPADFPKDDLSLYN